MLTRYTMIRGAPAAQLPPGLRQDSRQHTRHPLRPSKELVNQFLGQLDDAGWAAFAQAYKKLIEARFAADRAPFDQLAKLAGERDVLLGCSCPTLRNPLPGRCHTYLALSFMESKYPKLIVSFP